MNEQIVDSRGGRGGSERVILAWHAGRWYLRSLWIFGLTGWLLAAGTGAALWYAWSENEEYFDTTGGIFETYHSGSKTATAKIAIIDVRGVIVNGETVRHQIERVREDEDVKAIVLRVESPGGTVTGSDYIYHHLDQLRQELEIPMVVSMGGMAASGGYYVSMAVGDQEDCIFAEPTTTTGSIGVILPHYDFSGLMQRFDVKDDSIRSHQNKQMLSMTRPMTAEQRVLLQAHVNDSFERFKSVILAGRPRFASRISNVPAAGAEALEIRIEDPQTGRDLATGEVFTARQALAFGLIDRVGFIEDAIERAAELAGLPLHRVRVVRYARPKPLIEFPDLIREQNQIPGLELLQRPVYPHAWYLAAPVPPLYSVASESDAFDL